MPEPFAVEKSNSDCTSVASTALRLSACALVSDTDAGPVLLLHAVPSTAAATARVVNPPNLRRPFMTTGS